MPRTAANITHVTYPVPRPEHAEQTTVELAAVRVHPSKSAALEYAVDEGATKYVPVRAGESLAEAIARYTTERAPKPAAGGTVRTPRATREAEGTEGFVAGKPREL